MRSARGPSLLLMCQGKNGSDAQKRTESSRTHPPTGRSEETGRHGGPAAPGDHLSTGLVNLPFKETCSPHFMSMREKAVCPHPCDTRTKLFKLHADVKCRDSSSPHFEMRARVRGELCLHFAALAPMSAGAPIFHPHDSAGKPAFNRLLAQPTGRPHHALGRVHPGPTRPNRVIFKTGKASSYHRAHTPHRRCLLLLVIGRG
jgi:hypothetical protein